ncbi:hypothetical protein [Streptomyces sp. NBC_01104]|uniref:hypothetical protein n=1 Tax=Streptomyces sp. NBC_01104 TaxID=2903750 RepID=UPI003867A09A|nr:hypothetical protein OG450_15415 [Streptomyces sp. NBC_01104]
MTPFAPGWVHADHPDSLDSPRLAWLPESYGEDGRFRTKRLLAAAGQGYAVLAEDRWSGGDVVIKGMWWSQAALDNPRNVHGELAEQKKQRDQGLRAARQAAQLTQQCPVVISVESQPSPSLVADGRHGGQPGAGGVPYESFIVQQFIGHHGGVSRTLQEEIDERAASHRRFKPDQLLDLAEQLCNTLTALHADRHFGDEHSKGWIHADIKPENILVLGPPARYVLIDYDAAVQIGERIRTTTRAYAPPSAEGTDEPSELAPASERFDIYMLGATLAHAAALRRITDRQARELYAEDFDVSAPARRFVASLRYGPILTNALTTCLSAKKFRLATVDRVRTDLARARSATALQSALRTLGEPR